jgi:hypothetical protein
MLAAGTRCRIRRGKEARWRSTGEAGLAAVLEERANHSVNLRVVHAVADAEHNGDLNAAAAERARGGGRGAGTRTTKNMLCCVWSMVYTSMKMYTARCTTNPIMKTRRRPARVRRCHRHRAGKQRCGLREPIVSDIRPMASEEMASERPENEAVSIRCRAARSHAPNAAMVKNFQSLSLISSAGGGAGSSQRPRRRREPGTSTHGTARR